MKALLLYSSHDGQTRAIMSAIADEAKGELNYDIYDINTLDQIDLTQYQAILIGAAIRYGHFNQRVKSFVQTHHQQLNQMQSAFFSVTLTARKPEKRTPETNSYTRKFLAQSPWQPKLCAVFAGALHYPRYNWFDRFMIQLIMRLTGGETDTSKDIEYTDWQQVQDFGQRFVRFASKSAE